jgi:hypothetical protein
MRTVLSHIIQKRFSREMEDVATESLAYVLESSELARDGMMKLLRAVEPDLPPLRFKTQQAEGSIRPDMWGFSGSEPRVFIENKFWAGLTDNQPVSYLKQLAEYPQPTLLLFVAPATRERTLCRELDRRLADAGISSSTRNAIPGMVYNAQTDIGPIIALTSWTHLLSVLEHNAADDPGARGDLLQLRGLCDAADTDAFRPLSSSDLTDQRTPALILQLSGLVQDIANQAATENIMDLNGLRPQASWDQIGRYARFSSGSDHFGIWFGVQLDLWKVHGTSPLWLIFPEGDFGRALEVRPALELWAAEKDLLAVTRENDIALALKLPVGEEKAGIIRFVTNTLRELAAMLASLPAQ